MVKKLFGLIFICLLLVGTVAAWDFDNVYDYNPNSKTVTITNAFGFGERLARIQLMSDLDVKVIDRGPGVYQQVALIKFHEWVDEPGALEGISLYDVPAGMEKIDGRDIIMKYRVTVNEREVPIYERQCSGDNATRTCEQVQIGTEEKEDYEWVEFTELSELPKKNTFIGLFADVQPNEKVDWIPDTWFGETIEEWATWTEGLTEITQHYYAFDENTGTQVRDEVFFYQKNATALTGNHWDSAGLINSSYFTNAESSSLGFNIQNFTGPSELAISFWMRSNGSDAFGNGDWFLTNYQENVNGYVIFEQFNTPNRFRVLATDSVGQKQTTTIEIPNTKTEWQHIVMIINTTSLYLYNNGTEISKIDLSGFSFDGESGNFTLFSGGGTQSSNVWMDELAFFNSTLTSTQISDLYNGGSGIQFNQFATGDTAPTVTLNLPTNGTSQASNSVVFNCTAEDDRLIQNVTLYIDGTANETFTNGATNFSSISVTKTMAEGNHLWNCKAADNSTTIQYGWGANNFTVTVDSTTPLMNVSYPIGSIPFHIKGNNLSLNWTINDTNLDACLFEYNGVNTTLVCGANVTSFNVTSSSVKTGIVYANDTAGNSIATTITWDYNLFENSQTYNSTALEGAEENLILNISFDTDKYSLSTARLYYNGSFYSGTKTTHGPDRLFTTQVTTPDVNSASYADFNWEVTLSNATGSFIQNITNYSQLVSPIALAECDGATYTVAFINFTTYDEATQIEKNTTFEATFDYGSVGSAKSNTYSFQESNENQSRYNFCVTPADKSIEIDATITIGASNYVDTFYALDDNVLTNTTTLKSLYILNDTDSTSFIIKVRQASFEDLVGAFVHVDRYDVGTGTWLNTEIVETNYEGKAIAHLFSEDADYRFRVWYNGDNVYNSTSTKITCEATPCTVTLTIPGGINTGYSGFELPGGFSGTLTFTKASQTFTYTYEDTDSSFTNARLFVGRRTYGNATQPQPICNETKATSSGVITCDISSQLNGTYIGIAYLTRDSEEIVLIRSAQRGLDPFENIGLDGLLWGFFIFVGIVMLGVYRPSLGIIFGIVGLIALMLIKMVSMTITAIAAIIIIGLVLLWEISRE